jgi:hypothetical protein
MKKLLLSVVVVVLAATAPLSAHADGDHYRGGCGYFDGVVYAMFVAGNPTDHISGYCELIVNSVSQGDVLDATLPGTGFVAAGGRSTFTAPEGSVVQLCDRVTTTSGGAETQCHTVITSR